VVVSVRSNVYATYVKGSILCSIEETARNMRPHVGGMYRKVPEHSAVNFDCACCESMSEHTYILYEDKCCLPKLHTEETLRFSENMQVVRIASLYSY
jgi:hypothetical protein